MIPKQPRIVDKKYLAYLRGLACVICLPPAETDIGRPLMEGKSEPHHVRSRGAWGSDYEALPMCRQHHQDDHSGRLLARIMDWECWRRTLQVMCLSAYIQGGKK